MSGALKVSTVFPTERREVKWAPYVAMGKCVSDDSFFQQRALTETQVLRGTTYWFQMKPFVLLAHLSTSEPRLPVALAGVDVFGEAVKRVSRFNNIFTCDLE